MNPHDEKYCQALQRLLVMMNELRAYCPWDRQQTLESLRHLTIEETYELSEAILVNDLDAVKKELGDLLLHVVFYTKIAVELDAFDMADVINTLCEKLINRHPHVYGDISATNVAQVKQSWELLKLKEKKHKESVLSGVPNALPALIKALRIQEKAQGVGFDWQAREAVWEKVEEEMVEFQQSLTDSMPRNKIEGEFGDLLFSLVNYARFLQIDPETALEKSNKKFINRFRYIEEMAQEQGKPLKDMTLVEMDAYWEAAKLRE